MRGRKCGSFSRASAAGVPAAFQHGLRASPASGRCARTWHGFFVFASATVLPCAAGPTEASLDPKARRLGNAVAAKENRGRDRDDAHMHVLGEIVGATGFGGRCAQKSQLPTPLQPGVCVCVCCWRRTTGTPSKRRSVKTVTQPSREPSCTGGTNARNVFCEWKLVLDSGWTLVQGCDHGCTHMAAPLVSPSACGAYMGSIRARCRPRLLRLACVPPPWTGRLLTWVDPMDVRRTTRTCRCCRIPSSCSSRHRASRCASNEPPSLAAPSLVRIQRAVTCLRSIVAYKCAF